jgi:hypothetical protein
MSLRSVKPYLAVFNKGNHDQFLQKIIYSGIKFEVLNPDDLGSAWSEVDFVTPKPPVHKSEMLNIDKVLNAYQPKGLFAGLIDSRLKATSKDLEQAKQNQDNLIEITKELIEFVYLSELQSKTAAILKSNPKKALAFGHGLQEYTEKLNIFGQSVIDDFGKNHSEIELLQDLPEIDCVDLTTRHQVLIFDPANIDYVFDFKPENIKDYSIYNESDFQAYIIHSKEKIVKLLRSHGFDPIKLTKPKRIELAALYANLELEELVYSSTKHIFKLSKSNPAAESTYGFIAVHPDNQFEFEQIASEQDILIQNTEWEQEIVVWNQNSNLEPFKGVAQSIGTIDSKEFDPSLMIAFYFSLFFAFCLGDALYGLFLTAFCGYFLFFQKLKKGFKSTFRMFFVAGIATIVLGALQNSWAGDLFLKTPLNQYLESIQLINPLDSASKLPLNVYLADRGLSPIVGLLGFSVFIGLSNIMSGYVIKVINSFRSGDRLAFMEDLSWLFFITALVVAGVDLALAATYIPGEIILIIATLIMAIFTQGKSIISKVISSLAKIYNLIGFGADLLSFTRLIAVGLTGGIVATVINLLASLIFNSIPIFGLNYAVAGIILIAGHLFNFVISLFGAYINPLRLHYVEYLPKFYEGKGRNLSLTGTELKYLELSI